jgi:chromosome segregation ATPase
MTLDTIPDQIKQLIEHARAALDQEITGARKIVAAAKAETAAAQTALSDLQSQTKSAQDQLAAVNDELARRVTLAGLNREIAAARKTLAAVQADTVQVTENLQALKEQRGDASAKLAALTVEANRMIAIRTEGEAVMAHLRAQLQQVSLGQRP